MILGQAQVNALVYLPQFLSLDLWLYIGLTALFGFIGGIGYILIYEEFIPPYWVKDEEGRRISLVFGTLKELPAGAIGGLITTMGFFGGIDLVYAIHIALITGIGSTSILKRQLDKYHKNEEARLHYLDKQPVDDYQVEEYHEEDYSSDRDAQN